jgi:hypothetical protein
MSIKNKRFRIGDLVTRTYKRGLSDEVGIAAESKPYGIVLEIHPSNLKNGTANVLVYWFKDTNVHVVKARLNNARFLRLVNRA